MQFKVNDTVRIFDAHRIDELKGQVGTLTALLDERLKPCGPSQDPMYGQVIFSEDVRCHTGVPAVTTSLNCLELVGHAERSMSVTDLYCLSGHLEATIQALYRSKELVADDLGETSATINPKNPIPITIAAANAYDQAKSALDILLAEVNDEILNIKGKLKDTGFICPECMGEGKTLRKRSCAEDDAPDPDDPSDWEVCTSCDGIGYLPNQSDDE